jgi:hypothetical protein
VGEANNCAVRLKFDRLYDCDVVTSSDEMGWHRLRGFSSAGTKIAFLFTYSVLLTRQCCAWFTSTGTGGVNHDNFLAAHPFRFCPVHCAGSCRSVFAY